MPITFTDDAAKLVFDIMQKQGLDPDKHAFNVTVDQGSLAFDFTREIKGHKVFGDLKYFSDPRIVEDIVIANWECSDGRRGLIFLGKNEMEQRS